MCRNLNDFADTRCRASTWVDAGGIAGPMSDYLPRTLRSAQEVFSETHRLCMGRPNLPEPGTYWSDNASGIPILMVSGR